MSKQWYIDGIDIRGEGEEVIATLVGTDYDEDQDIYYCGDKTAANARLLAAAPALLAALREMVAAHPDDCTYDHHGNCQAHFLERDCSVARARAAISRATEEGTCCEHCGKGKCPVCGGEGE